MGCPGIGLRFARLVSVPEGEVERSMSALSAPMLPGGWGRRVPMRLEATAWWPRGGGVTLLELVPERPTSPTRAYFEAGNRYLDELVARLLDQARPALATAAA